MGNWEHSRGAFDSIKYYGNPKKKQGEGLVDTCGHIGIELLF